MSDPVLRVESIGLLYGKSVALQGVSLEVREGQTVCLLGGNGAGKSSVLKCVSGIERPQSGSVSFLGEHVERRRMHARVSRGLCHVAEGRQLFNGLTVDENLRLGSYRRGRGKAREMMNRVFELFPVLKERLQQRAGTMSGGEQQMLAIARALMADPRLILLDEPSLGLAPSVRSEVMDVIRTLNDDWGLSVLLVEQEVEMALAVSDYAYVLEGGKVALQGSSAEVRAEDRILAVYLGAPLGTD